MNADVMPRDDLIEHEQGPGCVCGPSPLYDYGRWIYVHHSLDGRELHEGGR